MGDFQSFQFSRTINPLGIINVQNQSKYSSDLNMHRFFIPATWIQPPLVHIQGETARQIALVLRLPPGTVIAVLDGSPVERSVRLSIINKNLVEGEIISEEAASGEPRNQLSLYIALTQRTKFEWILQKGTELGVYNFTPVITSRSLVRETAGDARKVERWESILREAAEQCGRGRIPELLPVLSFEQALTDAKTRNGLCLFAWEKETSGSLKESLSRLNRSHPVSIAALIGPEGGFTDAETHQAVDQGWIPVSLGRRILRMETAALAIATLIMYELGELKPPTGAVTGS
jgi:16S rRNA (uracil1498-N3)-methyltransferase